MKRIAIIVTLDTKSEEAAYLRDRILELGHQPLIVDVGCGGLPQMDADITAVEVAEAAGADLETLRASRDRDMATGAMIRGAVVKLNALCQAGQVEGLISIGGMSSAVMASSIYRDMPYRIPKLLLTTAASMPQASRFFGPSGVTVMHSLVEVGALNRLLMGELARAAGAICGMVEGQASGAGYRPNSSPWWPCRPTAGWRPRLSIWSTNSRPSTRSSASTGRGFRKWSWRS